MTTSTPFAIGIARSSKLIKSANEYLAAPPIPAQGFQLLPGKLSIIYRQYPSKVFRAFKEISKISRADIFQSLVLEGGSTLHPGKQTPNTPDAGYWV